MNIQHKTKLYPGEGGGDNMPNQSHFFMIYGLTAKTKSDITKYTMPKCIFIDIYVYSAHFESFYSNCYLTPCIYASVNCGFSTWKTSISAPSHLDCPILKRMKSKI